MKIESKALEANIASYSVDVSVDPKYSPLIEIMSKYYGLMPGLTTFLKELSHPYMNWQFIVKEARSYSLDYFHLFKNHLKGPEGAGLFVDIFTRSIESTVNDGVRAEAIDYFLLFIQKVIKDSGDQLQRFMPVLDVAFHRVRHYPDEVFVLFVKSYYQIKKLAEIILKKSYDVEIDLKEINLLLTRYYLHTYSYWLNEPDPQAWFEAEAGDIQRPGRLKAIFRDVSHNHIQQLQISLENAIRQYPNNLQLCLEQVVGLPGYNEIVDVYKTIPRALFVEGAQNEEGNNKWKLIFLFHIMHVSGLSLIHEDCLRDINRTLSWVIINEKHQNISKLIDKTFSILKSRFEHYPGTSLSCVLNVGKGVYKTDDIDLVNFFIDSMINLGFQVPMIGGVGNDWQIKVNPAHLLNIRTWLELIELNPKRSTRLLSYLIIHLSLCGVFIKDTDLFPRDITRLLNRGIGPVYNLVKQLCKLFPVYFNDIGAEGQLRDISTEIDEILNRKDVLVHFLRKQSHVESSNRIVSFMEASLKFWETGDKTVLEPFVPPVIFNEIESGGRYVDGVCRCMTALSNHGIALPKGLLILKNDMLHQALKDVPGVTDIDRKRVELAVSFYKLLHHKYNLDFIETGHYIAQLQAGAFPRLDQLNEALSETDTRTKLVRLIDYLEMLKQLILSDQAYEIREDIYKKRHFAVDIPSMYGCYHEMKFDALGLTFRIESLVNVLLEEVVDAIDLNLITKATFYEINDLLLLFDRVLKLDGIASAEFERQLDFLAHSLGIRGFTFTQFLDIFKGFAQAVKNIINDYFNNIHDLNLNRILSQIPFGKILKKFLPQEEISEQEKLKYRILEIFSRDRLALSLGLPQLDLFLTRILHTLFRQSDKVPADKLLLLLNYDPQRAITFLEDPNKRVNSIIYLGNKGANLVRLKEYGLPVPPGFIVTTEVFRSREMIESYAPAAQNFSDQVAQHIAGLEKKTGKIFGDPKKPLLLSVRSGASISQPGMMDTFLNVGINEDIASGIADLTGNAWFAWDSYRRFLQGYGMSYGLKRDDFDAIIDAHKHRLGIPLKRGFAGDQMKRVALDYKQFILDAGFEIIEQPFEQLSMIIKRVSDSWESGKAKTYRKIIGISDDWGTAVTVQKMVFGNISRQSGTGVFFTHNPRWSEDVIRLWGDFSQGNQGEDVVAGLVQTLPISEIQISTEKRETDISLQTHFPDIYSALKRIAVDLVNEKGWSPQEMEFTFESPDVNDLYILQSRDMAFRERKKVLTFDIDDIIDKKFLGHGIGVSGGAISGRVVFNLDEIDKWRRLEPFTSLILVRSDTVPDDIREIYAADGLLTARGGLTSHAAVVAHRLERICVVGCADLLCNEKEKWCSFNQVNLHSGDYISIDGQQGTVYWGRIKINES